MRVCVCVYTHQAQAHTCIDVHGFVLDCVHAVRSHHTSSTVTHHFMQVKPVTTNPCLPVPLIFFFLYGSLFYLH